jgi:hypothetical protein
MTSQAQSQHDSVQEYYGEILKGSADLKTNSCCPIDTMPEYIRPYLIKVHKEIQDKFYGCGSPTPPALVTNVPEVFLAREAQICYAIIGIATDYELSSQAREMLAILRT